MTKIVECLPPLLLFLSPMLFGQPQSAERPSVKQESFTFGSDEYCPYYCKTAGDKSDSFRGFFVDIVEATMADEFRLEFAVLPWSRALIQAKNGQLSGLLGASQHRKKSFDLAEEPFLLIKTCLIGRMLTKFSYSDEMSLEKLKLGLIKSYDYSHFENYIKKHGENPAKVEWIAGERATFRNLNKLMVGRVDGIIDDLNLVMYQAKRNDWQSKVTPFYCFETTYGLYLGISKKQTNGARFLEKFNTEFAKFKKTEAFRQLEKKYSFSN